MLAARGAARYGPVVDKLRLAAATWKSSQSALGSETRAGAPSDARLLESARGSIHHLHARASPRPGALNFTNRWELKTTACPSLGDMAPTPSTCRNMATPQHGLPGKT